jgi:SAM-dependent methyltransferase
MQTQPALRSDYEWLRVARREKRTLKRIVAHYELERDLARQLMASTREQRSTLYGAMYDKLFEQLPDHPQWTITDAARARQADSQIRIIAPLLDRSMTFLEVGCGDAILVKKAAPLVRLAIGADVTDRLLDGVTPENFKLVLSDGIKLPVESGSVDIIFSNHLIEHMHPEDVGPHLTEVLRVLKPGGCYACATPNRLNGPHDISVFFGHQAAGFHLREYDHRSLAGALRQAGFVSLRAIGALKGVRYSTPLGVVAAVEAALSTLPTNLQRKAFHIGLLYRLSQVMVIGRK